MLVKRPVFAMQNEFLVDLYYENRRLKLSNFLWFLKYETRNTTNGLSLKGLELHISLKCRLSIIFKNEFQVKMPSNQFDLHFTLLEMS